MSKHYTILVSKETFFTQEVEANSEDAVFRGDYKILSESQRSTAPTEVIRIEEADRTHAPRFDTHYSYKNEKTVWSGKDN